MTDGPAVWSPLPSAIDTVDGVINSTTIICEDNTGNVVVSGNSFAVGTTTVTCRVNDTSLNEGSSQFDITVLGTYFVLLSVSL